MDKKQKQKMADCAFMESVYEFADYMLSINRRDVYYGVLLDFMYRAKNTMTTEEAAEEFAAIRRLYNTTQHTLVDTVYSAQQMDPVQAAYLSEYYKRY